MPIEAVIYLKRLFEKKRRPKTSIAQVHDTFGHLVLLDYNIITYDRVGLNHRENMCKNILYFRHRGLHPTHLVCVVLCQA